MKNVRMPRKAKGRERRLSHGEEQKFLEAVRGYGGYLPYIVIFALETGMRRGEIARLQWKDVDLKKCTAIARNTKNGEDRTIAYSGPS